MSCDVEALVSHYCHASSKHIGTKEDKDKRDPFSAYFLENAFATTLSFPSCR